MKKRMNQAMAMGMVFAMAGSTIAFAEDATTPETAVPISEIVEGTAVAGDKKVDKAESAFTKQDGKVVSSVKDEKGSYQVEISNENGGLRFMVAPETKIINREDGTYLTPDKLVADMQISVIYGANSPMGMSMPPFLGQVTAVVANADKGNFSVGIFNEDFTNIKDMLKLNISEDTNIQNMEGTKIRLMAEDVKGTNALVFYDATTRSIPAQTNPSFVLILDQAEILEAVPQAPGETKMIEEMPAVALREKAEEMGFKVTWQGKDKAILVENEAKQIAITVGSATYVVDEKEMTSDVVARLVDGVLMVGADVLA